MVIQVLGERGQPWRISLILRLPQLMGKRSACLESLMVRYSLIISCLGERSKIMDIKQCIMDTVTKCHHGDKRRLKLLYRSSVSTGYQHPRD